MTFREIPYYKSVANLQYTNFTELSDLEDPKVIFQSKDLIKIIILFQ